MATFNETRVKTTRTIDELRAEEDLPPLPDGAGAIILDPVFLQNKQLAQQQQMAEQQMGMQPQDGADDGDQDVQDDKDESNDQKTVKDDKAVKSHARRRTYSLDITL